MATDTLAEIGAGEIPLLHEIQETYPGASFDYRPDRVSFTLRSNRRLSGRLAPYIIRQ